MKKSDFIYLLSKNLKDYNETDVNISANLIQKAIIESLKKRNRIEKEQIKRNGRDTRSNRNILWGFQ